MVARLPCNLLHRLDMRHVHDKGHGQGVELKAGEAEVRDELDLILAIASERLRIGGRRAEAR